MEGVARGMNPRFHFLIISEGCKQAHRKLRAKGRLMKSRPGHHNKVGKREEALKILPGLDFHKSIPSKDKEENGTWMPLPEIPDRVDRIRLPRSLELNIRYPEERICQGCQPHHLKTMLDPDDILHPFVGRNRCRNEDYFLEPKGLPDFFRAPEVALMDGIERSPKKTGPLLSRPSVYG